MNAPYPLVETAVVLMQDAEGRYLVDWNENWGSFTFPATKVHDLPGALPESPSVREKPLAAACRAVAEVLGRPIDPAMVTPMEVDVPPYQRSGRDGQWKRYTVRLFRYQGNAAATPLPGHVAIWLTRDELARLEPISKTAREILGVL